MSAPKRDSTSAQIVRVVILSLPIFLVLNATSFLAALLAAWLNGTSPVDRLSLQIGICCGLIVWAFVGIFHLKRETILVPVPRRGGLLDHLQVQLEDLGYRVVERWENGLAGRPSFQSLLLGGGVEVHLEPYAVRLTGPKLYLEVLRNRLRMHNFVAKVQESIRDAQRRHGERLLKRVEISVRVPLEQWLALYDEVIDVLAKEDAEVVCDVQILAHSKLGIRDSTVELLVRDWLKQQHIKAEIRKELAPAAEVDVTPAPPPPVPAVPQPEPAGSEGPVA